MASLTGSTTAVFFVRLSTAVDEIVDVDWNTRDGTAIAGKDYEAASGTVSFLPGETEKAIDVVVYGQDDVSADGKKFYIELKPPANAVLTDALAECVITVADEDGVLVTSLVIAQGKRGFKGNPGLSAYEQAVLMGYTGTVEQWMGEIGDASQAAERAESFTSQAIESAVIAGQKAAEAAEAVISTKQYVDGALASQSAYLDSELANQTQTVNSALSDLSTAANKFYPTLADANADIANIQVDQPVTIGESANGGLWYKATAEATTLTKSDYDPLTQSKNYTEQQVGSLKSDVLKKLYVSLDDDLHQFADVEGNIVARIDQKGMFHVVGIDNPIQTEFSVQKQQNKAATENIGTDIQKLNRSLNILSDQSDLHIFTDADGYIVAKISHDGQLHVVGLNEPIQIELSNLNNKVIEVSDTINYKNFSTDDLYLVTDKDGNVVAKIKNDGRYYIVGLANDIATEFESVRDEINRKSESIKDTSIAENRSYKDTVTPQVQSVLNTLMYAQTGAKAPAPLHYFPQNYTINKTWINDINQFGHANSTRLEINSPYRDDDGVVHPHILEFYNGFRGYRYIVAITPYYLTNEAVENPCIYGSNDLIAFDLLDGFEQPLDVRPAPAFSNGHNSDNVLAYDPRTGELICIWRQTLRNPNNDGVRVDALWMRKTKDGYSWTDRERIFKARDHALAGGAGSPAIVYDIASGYWYMYLTTLSTTTDAMRLFRAKSLKENAWEYVSTLTLPFKPWHQDIKIVGNKVCMLVYCYPPDNTIYFGISNDFTNFEWTQNLLLENNGYKSSFVPEFNNQNQMALKILYSTNASPSEASEKWRMYMHQTNFMNVSLELR